MLNLKALYIAKSVRGRKRRGVDLVDVRGKREREREKKGKKNGVEYFMRKLHLREVVQLRLACYSI